MRFVLFYHSLLSDWNHGNAHFLRGIATELLDRGHSLQVYEPMEGWSFSNLLREQGNAMLQEFHRAYPHLFSTFYDPVTLDLDEALDQADVVIVHEWSEPDLVQRIGAHRARNDYVLLFHDTHHRALTDPAEMARYDLSEYDGVLAFGRVMRDLYLERQWSRAAWVWHEAADPSVFKPLPPSRDQLDLVWIGNWGDGERSEELSEFLLKPIQRLQLKATIHGVRYPAEALERLQEAGATYGGWLANFKAPQTFADHRVTVHIPRRPYRERLPGIPTIRVFEALACAIPLISAPWDDSEQLFTPGEDFLMVPNGAAMERAMRAVLHDRDLAAHLSNHGQETILNRHTCAHRVDELLQIVRDLRGETEANTKNIIAASNRSTVSQNANAN